MTQECMACGKEIERNPKLSRANYARRQYCDRACRRAKQPDIASDYEIVESGCWEWRGYVDRNGYGKAYDADGAPGRRIDWAHRVSYRRHKGPIPAKHDLDHLCENTVCINPDHLEPVKKLEHARRTMRRLGKDDLHAHAATLRSLNLNYAEIAAALGYATKTGAADAVNAAIAKGLVDADSIPRVLRLDDEDRSDIRALYAFGIPQTEIAAWYGIDSSQISRICNGRSSGHSKGAAA